ncbi:MAG: DUF1289 domain-containing protein [Lautropia sp.]
MPPEPTRPPAQAPGNLRSPCVSICRIEVATGYCAGCCRTIDEIADWAIYDDDEKRAVWLALRGRRAAVDAAIAAATDPADPGRHPGPRPFVTLAPRE